MQFYPGDWRKDLAVQSLDWKDRGIWHEMLMVLHDSERRGVFVLNGLAMSNEEIARAIGADISDLIPTLANFERLGVSSREPSTGALMNRRMVRDEELRKKQQNWGKLGGNPKLTKNRDNPTHKADANPSTKAKPTPSSSSSPSGKKLNYLRPFRAGLRGATEPSSSSPGSPASVPPTHGSAASPSAEAEARNGAGGSGKSPGRGKGASKAIGGRKTPKKLIAADSRSGKRGTSEAVEVDPRFAPFREEIFRAFDSMYAIGLVKTRRPSWGPLERKQMNLFLESNPDVDFAIFKQALINWSCSDNVVLSDPPYRWIAKIMAYSMVRQDRFGLAKLPPRRL
jgi:hypothetical protein